VLGENVMTFSELSVRNSAARWALAAASKA
jgi:hypothetical protein